MSDSIDDNGISNDIDIIDSNQCKLVVLKRYWYR